MKNELSAFTMLLLMLLGMSIASIHIPTAISNPISAVDYENALIKTADRLVTLQSTTDYGWDWIVTGLTTHSPNPSAGNLYGVTALGLLDAYLLTGNPAYFNAAKAVADYLVSLGSSRTHYQFDLEFLIGFAEISGEESYYEFALNVWEWMKANVDRYADGHQADLYNYYYDRYGNSHGGATWATGDWAIATLKLGDADWAKNMTDVIAANYTKMEPDPNEFQYVGWGKALKAFQAVDPTAYADEITDIVNILETRQKADGSFTGWVQDEAYLIMGLVSVGEVEMAKNAAIWLVENQGYDTIIGGWKLPDGNEYSEVTSEAGQAIFHVIQAIGKVYVDHGSDGTIDLKTMTIQQAINAAYPGDTIIVNPGIYREALYIDKSLTLKGVDSPIIEAPDVIPLREFTGPSGTQRSRPIIFVYGDVYVIIEGFVVDGRGLGKNNYGFIGIQYFGASGEIKNNVIKAIRDTPLSGSQHGNAIVVNHLWDQYCEHTVTIISNRVFDFQKNGITCNEPGTYAVVVNNIVTGYGLTDKIAQNGIQFGWNATGIIEGNTVSGHKYVDVASWWSSGILLYQYNNGTVVHYNTVTDNNVGVFVYASSDVIIHYNNIYDNTEYGVYNEPSAIVDARFNWWGDPSGPYHATSWIYDSQTIGPHYGLGDNVSDYVLYDPYLEYPWPTYPTLKITPPSYQAKLRNEIFSVNITINNLSIGWKAVAFQFRLCYDSTLLKIIDVAEGPFLKDPRWNLHGTWFIYFVEEDTVHGPNIIVGLFLLPNETGQWTEFPRGSGTLATITFKAIYQHKGLENPPLSCHLKLKSTIIENVDAYLVAHNLEHGYYEILPTNIGDVNYDGIVDVRDLSVIGRAFGSTPEHPRWNSEADVNLDGVIDIRDVSKVARNFGWVQDP